MTLFCYLKYGLAGILGFVGVKMLAVIFDIHVPVLTSLMIIVAILVVAIGASWFKTRKTGVCPVVQEVQAESCPALKDIGDEK
jgi:tellurite resistance protein TerC